MNEIVFPYKIFSAFKYTLLDMNGWIAGITTVTVLLVLVILSLCVINRLDKKQSKRKIEERDRRLAEKEDGKSIRC